MTLSTDQMESLTRLICCVDVSTKGHSGGYGGGAESMNAGTAVNRATGANEGIVGNVEKKIVMRTDEVAEERDLVGVYLHEISRTPLLDAAREVDLSKSIEAGLYAEHLLGSGRIPAGVGSEELERLVVEGSGPRTCSSGPTCGWSCRSPAATCGPGCRCWT
ncbi:hypothetical protein GCM10027605_59890 [Micromonospora zhanjiangensis]